MGGVDHPTCWIEIEIEWAPISLYEVMEVEEEQFENTTVASGIDRELAPFRSWRLIFWSSRALSRAFGIYQARIMGITSTLPPNLVDLS